MQTLFDTTDEHFAVDTDGTLKLTKQLTLHDGHKRFSVQGLDSQGRKHTVDVLVELHQQHQHHVDLDQVNTGSTALISSECFYTYSLHLACF